MRPNLIGFDITDLPSVGTNTLSDGSSSFSGLPSTHHPARFYRLVRIKRKAPLAPDRIGRGH